MTHFRTIEVDFDVHKCIENERRSFDEPANAALRRLLKLSTPSTPRSAVREPDKRENGRPWLEQGVLLSHGTPIRMLYDRGRQKHEGRVDDGQLRFGDSAFDSVSGAASELALTKKGKRTNLNGWRYFQYKDAQTGKWTSFDDLRRNRRPLGPEELGL